MNVSIRAYGRFAKIFDIFSLQAVEVDTKIIRLSDGLGTFSSNPSSAMTLRYRMAVVIGTPELCATEEIVTRSPIRSQIYMSRHIFQHESENRPVP